MNKTAKIWSAFSIPVLLLTWLTHWANHPSAVNLLKGNAINTLYLLVPVMLLGWFLRAKILQKPNQWVDHGSVAFLLGYLAAKGFPKVHTYNEASRSMWIMAITAVFYLALLLWWDEVGVWIKKNALLQKIPTPVYLILFLTTCLAIWTLVGWEGRYVMTALGLAPLARYFIGRQTPQVLKAFGLFLATDVLIGDWPPANEPSDAWQLVVVLTRLLLSMLVFIFWEKLKQPKTVKWRWALLAFTVLPMFPYYYLGYGNWTWPTQAVLLGLLWAWDPWLKPHKREVWLGGFSAVGFLILSGQDSGLVTILTIVILTWVTGDARRHFLKLPRDLFKLLALYTLGGICFGFGGGDFDTTMARNTWLGFHLILAGLVGFFWEKLREKKNKCRIAVGLFALLPLVPAFLLNRWVPWIWEIVLLSAAWAYDAFGLKDKASDISSKLKLLADMPWFQKTSKFLMKKGEQSGQGIVKISNQPTVRKVVLGIAAVVALFILGTVLYDFFSTRVISFTPMGTVTSPNTVIRVRFSGEVSVASTLDSAFQIEPPLPGTTRLEDANTLVFTPAAPLKPATTYKVHLKTDALRGKQFFLQGTASTSFSTEPLKVVSSRLFYNYDLIKGTEKELMGELEFNYPVDMNLLKQNLTVFREGDKLDYALEQGTLPTRFFLRAGGLSRQDVAQTLKIVISSDMTCVDCGKPLGSSFEKTITLEARPKLLVDEIKLHHVPGNTLISILFTLPVSATQVRNNVSIDPAIPFKVDTEYCYAVLKADFQPNTDYTVKVSKGIVCTSGQVLEQDSKETLRLEDIQPYVRFADAGRLIPEEGGKIVAVKTMNLDNYTVDVEKVFRNNIVDFLKNSRGYNNYRSDEGNDEGEGDEGSNGYEVDNTSGMGVHVFSSNVTVEGGQINQEAESDLDFSKWHQAPYKGLFVVSLTGAEGGGRDSRSFLCTDLGMLMKRSGDDLLVQVLSISKLLPEAGVHLQLLSDNNQVIEEKDTDVEGRAWFKDWKNNPYNFRPYVIVATLGDDWSYLRTDQEPLNQSRFDVGGDPFTTSGWDAFLSSERGLYRPGETAYFTAVVRHADLEIPDNLPVNLTIHDVSGNEVAKLKTQLKEYGMATFTFPIPQDISTGMLSADLGLENGVHLATASFKVEEFIPEKIKVEVKPAKKVANPGEQLAFQVKARELFGAPGVNLKVRASVQLSSKEYTSKKWKGYHFSDPTREFPGQSLTVPDGTTDAAGLFDVQLPVPISMLPPSMLQAEIYAEVLDTGGRPVGANAVLDVHRYPYYLGLKCEEGTEAAPGKKVHIKYAAVTPDGEPTTIKQQVFLVKRKVWYSIFRRSGWSGRGFESAYYEQVVDGKEIDVDGKGSYTFTPDKPGEYTIYLGNEESMRSSILVSVTGPEEQNANEEESPANLQEPEKLSLTLDKAEYAVGEIPKVEVRAPFAGRLMLSIEREQVFYTSTVPVVSGLNVISLPAVESSYLPNAYVVGLLVRKPDEALRRLPMASFGITTLTLDTSGHEIGFKWDAPEAVKSHDGIDVNLQTGAPGSKVVLAAVDEGILQIIAFTTPDPFKYFYRKRGLTTSTLSLFEDVLPDLNRKEAVGGDEGEGFGFRHLNPIAAKRVKSFALFSGILTADKEGKVTYHFPTDKFQGDVRVMALGVEDNKFGASAFHVKVADPVVVEPSFPRFLAPGDRFDVPVLIYNNTKEKQTISVALSAEGPVAVDGEATQSLGLSDEGQKQILFHAKAKMDAGVAHFKVTATDESGGTYDVDTELAVRPGNALSTEIKFGPLSAGGTETLQVPGGFIPQGQKIRLAVSSSPLLTFLGSMDYLIRYPYGCAEQKTSTAFPLLYFKDIGLLTGRFPDRANAVEEYVQGGINDLCKQQLSDGSFALWAGQQESGGDWLFYYVANFLIEAQKKGYDVNADVMEKIYNRLGAIQVSGKGVGRLDRRKQNVEIPDSSYVLYLKALAGRPDVESMAAFKGDLPGKPIEQKCFLSLAYSAMGDRTTALSILPVKYLPSKLQRELNGDWFSPNREMALYLLALTEADPQNAEIPNLLIEFGKNLQVLGTGYFGTTEEDAWCFMAIGKAVKATTQAFPLSASWSIKGGEAHELMGETAVVKAQELSGKTVELKNTGTQPIFYHLMAEGTKLESKKESVENGISITREYRDEKGNTVNLGSVAQGQLVVVTLRLKCAKSLDNVVIVDLLPAGFEVDNPRLSSRGDLQFEPDCSFSPEAMDFRDDRVLLFSGAWEGEQAFSYSVRAVTPGQFQVPGVTAEAMYDPEIFGRTNTGETLIVAPGKY